jgi:hypothetical protein
VAAGSSQDSAQTDPSDLTAIMSKSAQMQEQVNQNVLQQAAAFLSPDQLQTLANSQSNMMAMQKLGASMAQKMFNNAPAAQ